MCCGKKIYTSKRQADTRAKNLGPAEGKRLWSYKCEHGKWHLTSKKPAKRSFKRLDGSRAR